jgi:hypothetical protein
MQGRGRLVAISCAQGSREGMEHRGAETDRVVGLYCLRYTRRIQT